MKKVDLNCDLGESFGVYKLGMDEDVLKHISSANIACGWHAGDAIVMEKTVKLAKENNVAIGVHPGYPDLAGFGRRNMDRSTNDLKAYVKYQIGALDAFAKSHNLTLQHVKPHGAMYNTAAKDYNKALAIAEAIKEVNKDLILMGLASSELIKAGKAVGLKVANEVFADRAYNEDGTLVKRGIEGAVIHDKELAIKRVIRMIKEGKIETITGKDIEIEVDSICIHGDNPEALEFAKDIKEALIENEVEICSLRGDC